MDYPLRPGPNRDRWEFQTNLCIANRARAASAPCS